MATEAVYRQIALAFKRVLKSRGITYEDLAERLDVSERTIKRMIGGDDGSIGRIAEACEAVGVKFFDLMTIAQEQEDESFELTLEQEEFLAESTSHHVVFRQLIKGWTFDEIHERHALSKRELRGIMRDLESFGLVERYEGDRIESPFANRPQNFISGGPLQYAVGIRDLQHFTEFLYSRDDSDGEERVRSASMSSGTRMSQESIDAWIEDAERLAEKYVQIAQREQSVLADDKLIQLRWLNAIVYPFSSWIDKVRLGEDAKRKKRR